MSLSDGNPQTWPPIISHHSLPPHEEAPGFAELGIVAFTTTRQAGSFNLASAEPAAAVYGRWTGLVQALRPGASRLACSLQVHGERILRHDGGWSGWLRDTTGADGHLTSWRGTGMAVTLADCVPVFVAHHGGVGAVLHSGWKGTAARILEKALTLLAEDGLDVTRALVHLGPAICGRCYEVGPDVYEAVTGRRVQENMLLDLRAALVDQARQAGATVTVSPSCTKCHNERFYSHRAGDEGRQLGVLVVPA